VAAFRAGSQAKQASSSWQTSGAKVLASSDIELSRARSEPSRDEPARYPAWQPYADTTNADKHDAGRQTSDN